MSLIFIYFIIEENGSLLSNMVFILLGLILCFLGHINIKVGNT